LTDKLEEIIKGCIKEDRQSQEDLYRILSPVMYAVCLRYASDADEAGDFMQEGFIRVFTKIKSYRNEGSFEGWVRRIMVNTSLQLLRKSRRMFLLNEEVIEGEDYEINESQCELDVADLLNMVQGLPENQRLVFNLFVIEGYNHTEIANMTGIPENTSKSHLHRARIALKEMILGRSEKERLRKKKNV
jgi:RNA polymerase sigma factor (sigma-70 family)